MKTVWLRRCSIRLFFGDKCCNCDGDKAQSGKERHDCRDTTSHLGNPLFVTLHEKRLMLTCWHTVCLQHSNLSDWRSKCNVPVSQTGENCFQFVCLVHFGKHMSIGQHDLKKNQLNHTMSLHDDQSMQKFASKSFPGASEKNDVIESLTKPKNKFKWLEMLLSCHRFTNLNDICHRDLFKRLAVTLWLKHGWTDALFLWLWQHLKKTQLAHANATPQKEAQNELSNTSNPEWFVTSGNLHTTATSHHRGPSDCMLCFIFRRKNTNNEQSFQTLHFCLRTQDKHAFATPTNINEVLASLAEAMLLFRQWILSKKKVSVNDVANKKEFSEKHVQNQGTELLHTQQRTWACTL